MEQSKIKQYITSFIVSSLIFFSNDSLTIYAASKSKKQKIKISDAVKAEHKVYSGDLEAAIDFFKNIAPEIDKNFALWNNQLGSVYLAKGDYELALDAFLKAYYLMNDVSAFKEREAQAVSLFGKEATKAYKGDPYEKVFNSLYVALLLYNNGDVENAMAALKTGILSDSDVKGDLYKSDSYLLYAFASRLALLQGNKASSEKYFKMAKDAYLVSCPNNRLPVSVEQEQRFLLIEKQKEIDELQNPEKYSKKRSKGPTTHFSSGISDKQEEKKATVKGVEKKIAKLTLEIKKIEDNIKELEEGRKNNDAKIDTSSLKMFIDAKNNVFLIIELGRGPLKYPVGQYGQFAVFTVKPHPVEKVGVFINNGELHKELQLTNTDSLFQAITRGGRQMDAILKGQAQFKQATAEISLALNQASQQITNQANQMAAQNPYSDASGAYAAAAIFSLISLCVAVASDMANPAADVRHWSLLPGNIIVAPLSLMVGQNSIHIKCFDSNNKVINESEFTIKVMEDKDRVIFKRIL